MKIKILNYLFFTILLLYSVFLISRVIWTRLPQTPEVLILFFLFYAISSKGLSYLMSRVIENKTRFFKKKNTQDGLIKKGALLFKSYNDNLEKFLKVDFTRKFLGKFSLFSIFFFFCVNSYKKLIMRKSLIFFFPGFLLLPGLFINLIFVLEVCINNKIYYVFYALAISFLFNRFLTFCFFIIENTLQLISNMTLSIYLKEFYQDSDALMFFLNNQDIRSFFFFAIPELQTKTIIPSAWRIFRYVMYSLRVKKALETFRLEIVFFKKGILNIKIILWSMILILVEIPCFFNKSKDFFIVFIIFFAYFLSFLVFLDFLEKLNLRENTLFQFKEIIKNEEAASDFLKNSILIEYDFLVATDLPKYVFKKARIWAKEKKIILEEGYNPNYLFNKEDKIIWENGVADIFQWYIKNKEEGLMINKENFEIITKKKND